MASEEELANLQRLSNDYVSDPVVRTLENERLTRHLMYSRDHL